MPKKSQITSIDISKNVMSKVKTNQIIMKPRWYFLLGSLLMILGLVGASMVAIFLTNLTLFLLRRHGPMGQWRLQQILESFPLWIPVLALVGMVLGIWMLKKYDFSYKKNFPLMIIGFIAIVIISAFAIDYLGINDAWSHQGPMRRFYQQFERGDRVVPKRPGRGLNRPQNFPNQ